MIGALERFGSNPVVGPAAVLAGTAAVGRSSGSVIRPIPDGHLPACPTKTLLGIVCPGCGTMRMLYSLMHGDIAGALHYNAVGLVAVVLLAWSFCRLLRQGVDRAAVADLATRAVFGGCRARRGRRLVRRPQYSRRTVRLACRLNNWNVF